MTEAPLGALGVDVSFPDTDVAPTELEQSLHRSSNSLRRCTIHVLPTAVLGPDVLCYVSFLISSPP